MLSLKNIVKNYSAGTTEVRALCDVSLEFRKSEFVSILGPSGCGKTTMLNIIGGLDQYTSGDLVINEKSTKDFKDRDWDAYRNHSVGFVFQSYNLIPHQTVLQNVEIALSLSGVPKSERKRRAKEALERVGLGDQLKKKPSEMSGGQMQRVAIARAIVNDPDIILADEPTGALDSETSVQVMEILKEISNDRLVIMVTHNPELAEKYSTRILKMLDGKILSDTAPLNEQELTEFAEETEKVKKTPKPKKKAKKPSMSFATSFSLSLKNLFTKKGRTLLTSFAGSIGIIGIALIYAVSQGMTTYIDTVQEETLTSYPLTIESTNVDINELMETFMGVVEDATEVKHDKDKIYSQSVMFDMINAFNNLETTENDLKTFKAFVDKELLNKESELYKALSGVQYTYDLDLQVYTKAVDGQIIYSDTSRMLADTIKENLNIDMNQMTQSSGMMGMSMSSSMMGGGTMNLWSEMLSGKDGELISPVLKNQYDVIQGDWPKSATEIVLVVDENNELDDLTLYALGLKSEEEINEIFKAIQSGEDVNTEQQSWSYDEIMNMEFKVIMNSDCFRYDEKTGLVTDLRSNPTDLQILYSGATPLKVTGIIRPKDDTTSAMISGSIGYTKELTEMIIEKSDASVALKEQKADEEIDLFTGLPFKTSTGTMTEEEKANEFKKYVSNLEASAKAELLINIRSMPTEAEIGQKSQEIYSLSEEEQFDYVADFFITKSTSVSKDDALSYVANMSEEDFAATVQGAIMFELQEQKKEQLLTEAADISLENQVAQFDGMMLQLEAQTEVLSVYYDQFMEFSDNTYDGNLATLGNVDLNDPVTVNLYASSFENKDILEEVIAEYNEDKEELEKIKYTDYVGIMMSSITIIINAITYVLIAFVAISLIVSSIMIGVITLISVQERTKEIGILRAIGASKKNVSRMFNAETMIIGFSSGLIGVLTTYLLIIPINSIINNLTGIQNLDAYLPPITAVILIVISVLLTLLSGIIPSRSAAKKDPVVALRTE